MKKLLAILLVAVLALALVACGGDPVTTTTEATGSSTTPDTTTTPDSDPVDPNPGPGGDVENPPLFSEGINILNGDYEYMAVEPFWYDGTWPCQFEDGHMQLDFNWALVFKMNETMEGVQKLVQFMEKFEKENR